MTKTAWKKQNVKHVIVRILGRKPRTFRHDTQPGKVFLEDGIDQLLEQYADKVDVAHPGQDFKMVEIPAPAGTRQFNFLRA